MKYGNSSSLSLVPLLDTVRCAELLAVGACSEHFLAGPRSVPAVGCERLLESLLQE